MMTVTADPEFVPSGFMHPDHRRVGGMARKTADGKRSTADAAAMIGRVFVERSVRAKELADALPAVRAAKKINAHSGAKTSHKSKAAAKAVGPTEERLAKGDVVTSGGVYRSAPPIEKLRKDGSLDHDEKTANAMFFAATKLKRHFDCSINGVRALDSIDFEEAMTPGGYSDLNGEEGWVHHHDEYQKAMRLLGVFPGRPTHGCARIVIAVVCFEHSLRDAAKMCLLAQREERMQTIALDRLRSGLLSLAYHWKLL